MDVCRICLSASPEKNIYQLKTSKKDGNKDYSDILPFCLGIQVSEDLTKKLCTMCFKKTISFYKFKTMAVMNDTYLRSTTKTYLTNKIEAMGIEIFGLPQFQKDCLENEIKTEINEYEIEIQNYKIENCEETNKQEIETQIEHTENEDNGSLKSNQVNDTEFKVLNDCDGDFSDADHSNEHNLQHINAIKSFPKPVKKKKIKREKGEKLPKLPKEKISGIYPCKFCEKIFKFASSRWRHIKFTHTEINGHCDICNKDVKHLKNHMMLMHDRSQLRHQCDACGRRFINEYTKRYHACSSTEQRGFGCDHCDKTFWCPRDVDRHVRKDHQGEKTFLCQFCSKSFFRNTHLTIHLRMHTNERPFKCPDCDKSFSTKTTLKHHQFTHTDNLQFACALCPKVFARPQYLRHHMTSHNKDRSRKYPCKYCGVAFTRSDTRKTHETNVHEKHVTS